MAAFDAHHSRKGASGGLPVCRVFVGEVLDAAHVSGYTFSNEHSSVETEGVAVLGVEIGGESAATFVSEEM